MQLKTLTVFTPSYNRAHLLPRLYHSLVNQTNKDFCWMIIDDGSTDNTSELVKEWINQKELDINYIYQSNGGMSSAHNTAYEIIETVLNICVDSDDWLPDDAIESILNKWNEEPEKEKIVGFLGLDADINGNIIGDCFESGLNLTTLSNYYKHHKSGDKKLVYKTEIMKTIGKYPSYENEKYIGLNYKYVQADQIGPLRVINKVICIVEYQDDGSSSTMFQQYINNPHSFAEYRRMMMQYPRSYSRLIIDCIHYSSSCIIGSVKNPVSSSPKPLLTIICYPLGWLESVYIRFMASRKSKNNVST